ncbi:MAG TPA: hypothetical protein VKR22_01805, partial [Acidimicrobiales bacterium]|nr:hypothetical protein [Acidimicrobiales bacterium]
FSRAMFFPDGLNVLSSTAALLVDLVLAPVTLAFGPVAAFTVAVTLAPAADALVAFAVLRRFTNWAPAAFAGGLLFGFGPFVATDLRYGHLDLTVVLVVPIALLLADRLVRVPPARPWGAGVLLAALVVGEFFVSMELLAMVVVIAAVIAVASLATKPGRHHLWAMAPALATGAVISGALLAYPLWWYLHGPRHFSGAVFGDMTQASASLTSFVLPHGQLARAEFLSGGNSAYLGVPLLVVLVAAGWRWRGDRILRFALALAGLCAVISLGPTLHLGTSDSGVPLPAWPLAHLPVVSSMATSRFAAITDVFCALALVRVLGHVHHALQRRGGTAAVLAPAGVALVALVPMGLAMPWPYPTEVLTQPAVLTRVASLPAGAVVREFPLPHGAHAEGLVWQAKADFSYATTDGYAIVPGPRGRATVSPVTGPLGEVFVGISLGRQHPPFSAPLVDGVRANAWGQGATAIVVVRSGAHAVVAERLLAAALGPPSYADSSGLLWLHRP